MDISRMAFNIVKIIEKKYEKYNKECLDIIQIKNICNIYKIKNNNINSISLEEINLSSPDFLKINEDEIKKKNNDILRSVEFYKKYFFFIKIIYSCLKMDIDIFDCNNDDIIILKNNFQLLKSLEVMKKNIINDNIIFLKENLKNFNNDVLIEYEKNYKNLVIKIKIINKLIYSINKIIDKNILKKTDSLLSLILPYFYNYTEFIEEYN